jgi:hypothetical protein
VLLLLRGPEVEAANEDAVADAGSAAGASSSGGISGIPPRTLLLFMADSAGVSVIIGGGGRVDAAVMDEGPTDDSAIDTFKVEDATPAVDSSGDGDGDGSLVPASARRA